MKTNYEFIPNGTEVKVKMSTGSIDGIVVNGNYNVCTFTPEYDIDYQSNETTRTLIGVPESAITINK